jgi:hypothetical protein
VSEISKVFDRLWQHKPKFWERTKDEEVPSWSKSCRFFSIYITEFPGHHEFTVFTDESSIGPVFEAKMAGLSLDEAFAHGDSLLYQLMQSAVRMWLGFEIGVRSERPEEIRLSQIAANGSAIIGIAEDGKAYRFRESSKVGEGGFETEQWWESLPMNVRP